MTTSFVIDALPEQAAEYREDHALVTVDVFRATTVILTALVSGRAVFPVSTVEQARSTAAALQGALLAGEQRGAVPAGFDLDNSPALLERLTGSQPLVLVTSAGTRLLQNCRGASAIYVACLRNLHATAEHLATYEERVALVGAGTAGQARPEDQLVCAWIGQYLAERGFVAENRATVGELEQYREADVSTVLLGSPSADWLRSSGKWNDVEFALAHLDDLHQVATFDGRQVRLLTQDRIAVPVGRQTRAEQTAVR